MKHQSPRENHLTSMNQQYEENLKAIVNQKATVNLKVIVNQKYQKKSIYMSDPTEENTTYHRVGWCSFSISFQVQFA